MNTLNKLLPLTALTVLVAACSSTPSDPYERRAYEERQRQEAAVERSLDKAPK